MARQPENTFISSAHRRLPTAVYWQKNHNQYNGGIADVWYSGDKADLWVEYKFLVLPKRPTTVIDLISGDEPAISHLQQDWLRSRHAEGRNVGVIVGCKDGGVWFPGTSWDRTYTTEWFRERVISRNEIASLIVSLVQNQR